MIRYVSLFAVLGLVGCGSEADTGSGETVTNCQAGMITGTYLQKLKLRSGTSGCPGDFEQVVQVGGPPEAGCQITSKVVDTKECSVTGTGTCDTGAKTTLKIYQRDNALEHLDGVATVELARDICTYDISYDRL